MQFGLSEEQVLLQDNVNRFLTDQAPLEAVRTYANGGDDNAIWQGLTELGVAALLIPEDAGGIGLDPLDAAIVAECLGYHCTPSPFISSAVMAASALNLAGGHAEQLAELAAGTLRVGIAFGEAVGRRADAGVLVEQGKLSGKSLFAFDDQADAYLVADAKQHLYR